MEVFDKAMLIQLAKIFSIPDGTVIFVVDINKYFKWNATIKTWEHYAKTNNTKTA